MSTPSERRPPVHVDEAIAASPRFDRRRLRLARESRGVSQRDLAERSKVTAAAISQFEKGVARPAPETVGKLATALQFPPSFFARSSGTSVGEELDGFFRSLRSTSATDRRRARARAQLLCYFTRILERHVHLPDLDLPRHEVEGGADREVVENVAAGAREAWKIGPGPIDNVVRTLERHGIVAARFPVESEQVDAFSVPFPDRPVVVLGSDKSDRGRSRFDAAHELGHLVMHGDEDCGSKVVETQANWFAAAFLMPANEIRDELPSVADWDRLRELKRRWSVSLAALLLRARALDVMQEQTYVQAMKTMSARGWRRAEPGHLGPPETPVLLGKAIEAVEEKGLSIADIAADADLPLDEVLTFVGAGSDTRPVVEL
jgi:Zn-dependent peptidase ImmA (M78 family)/transcriptional regulator with XRE-family HTH domain